MAGIYRNQTEGIISLSSDGTTWLTIADKNLGATQVYNDGDTLSEANAGKYYQWGNNYGFPYTGPTSTSTTLVDASNYGPGNYYSSSTFITGSSSPYNWDSSNNNNLRGGETGTNEAMQGPCPSGFHVPSKDDADGLLSAITSMLGGNLTLSNAGIYLKMPATGYIEYNGVIYNQTNFGSYTTTTPSNITGYPNSNYYLAINSSNGYLNYSYRVCGRSIRPFKNDAVIPYANEGWTKLYGDDLPDRPTFLKWLIKNGNYYYFGDAPIHISGLALDKSSISLTTVGQTEQLTATISPEGAVETKVVWSSSDETIATVSQNGLVTCVTPGECTITATCGGYSASCSVVERKEAVIDFLLVGGGGGGGCGHYGYGMTGGGGGGGQMLFCCGISITGENNIVVGAGGAAGCKGCTSSFLTYTAEGGGYGGGRTNNFYGGSSTNGGGGGGALSCAGGSGKCAGGPGGYCTGGGGGGISGAGQGWTSSSTAYCYKFCGGVGCTIKFDGCTSVVVSGGGGGGGRCCYSLGLSGGGTGMGPGCLEGCDAYACGAGGGGGACYSNNNAGGKGGGGLFMVRYPAACNYNITGGNCKYQCNGYCVHCFTSSGTLTVN